MDCRPGCGACCIAPSISSLAKAAGISCPHLTDDYRCRIFGQSDRPACCSGLQPSPEMCGPDRFYAMEYLSKLEIYTKP
jgi:hypothetical protein